MREIMITLWIVAFSVQALVALADEWFFHRKRGLPLWERVGHPIDTLFFIGCLSFALWFPYSDHALTRYLSLSIASVLVITKDEWVHAKRCCGTEHWLHSILFALHPVVLFTYASIWPFLHEPGFPRTVALAQLAAAGIFTVYQVYYWNWRPRPSDPINNDFYDELGEGWYEAWDHPIALLRLESKKKVEWIRERLPSNKRLSLLDIGCGAGFLSNELASDPRLDITGIDLSSPSLEIARHHDPSGRVQYLRADAYSLPFENETFDVICAMDFLEHVEEPFRVVAEASRLLKPGGLFFFHTFARNPLSALVASRGVEWIIPKSPRNFHDPQLFINPKELRSYCRAFGLKWGEVQSLRPVLAGGALSRLIRTGIVPADFRFQFGSKRFLWLGYIGWASKNGSRT